MMHISTEKGALLRNPFFDGFKILNELFVSFQRLSHFVAGMHHCCMITIAKRLANLWQRHIQQVAAQVHRELAGIGNVFASAVGFKVIDRNIVIP